MELLQLKYLCTAARLENFSRAALHHNIPQSAISKTIAHLERELGVRLFIRNGNRVTLSEAGRCFCREVQEALDILSRAADGLRGEGKSPLRGELRLLCEEHEDAVTTLVSKFRAAHPQVNFTVHNQAHEGVEYDIRITCRAGRGETDELCPAEGRLLVPATHRLAEWEKVPASALQGERMLSCAHASPAIAAAEARLKKSCGGSRPVLTCEDRHSLCDYVGAGVGIAVASGISERRAREQGIALVHLQEEVRYPTYLICHRASSPVVAAFRHAVIERLGAKKSP